jgi:hypothetical protein
MKKNLLFLFACAIGLMANGQSSETKLTGTKTKAVSTGAHRSFVNHANAKSPGVPSNAAIIYTQDFAAGIPSTWTITDNAGSGEVFTWTTDTSANGDQLSPNGTTAANGYVLFDSDGGGQVSPAEDCDLVTDAINCSGISTVFLSMNEYFLQFAASTGTVSISNDGINFTDVYSAETGLGQDQTSGNPHFVQADISSLAANQATVYLRFKYTGNWDYYWMFDDLTLFEPAAVDAGITASSLTSGCSLSSTTPVTITINNFGGSSISNIPVSFSVNGGAAVNEVAPGPIAPNTSVDYTFTATANLSTGASSSVLFASAISGDANTVNDTYTVTVDNFTPVNLSTAYVMDFEPGDDLSAWAVFDGNGDGVSWAPATTLVYSGTQCIRKAGSGSADDDWMWSGCFNMSAGSTYQLDYWYRQFDLTAPCDLEVFLATSQDVATSTQLIASEVQDIVYRLSSNTFTVPTNGNYYIAWHAFSAAGSSSIRVDLVNLGAATGINEATNVGGVKLFPNPAESLFAIQVKKYDNAMVRIFDVTGNEVYNAALNEMNTTVDVSNYASGLYLVKVEGQNFSYSEKLTVK